MRQVISIHATIRALRLLAVMLGFLGLVACIGAIFVAWHVSARLSQVTEKVFAAIDDSVITVQERIAQTQARVEASRIATEDIAGVLSDWTKRETSDRLALRLDLAERGKRLVAGLHQADHWIEVSESTAELAQGGLSMVGSTGAPMDNRLLDRLIGEIRSLRLQLSETMDVAARIGERTTEASGDKALGEEVDQATRLIVRVGATLGSIDSRLKKLENGLSETQHDLQASEARTLRWIRLATVGITLLAIWMAGGQAALCLVAWTGLQRTR